MARDPKASFKFTTIGSGAGGFTASADKLSGVYAMPATLTAGVAVISDVWTNWNETIGDAVRFGAQTDVPSVSAQPLILGGNGQNQLSFIKVATKNTGLAGTGLTDYKIQIVGVSQSRYTLIEGVVSAVILAVIIVVMVLSMRMMVNVFDDGFEVMRGEIFCDSETRGSVVISRFCHR